MTESSPPNRLWMLFCQARDLPEHERDEFLRRACGNDNELLAELTRLVHSAPPDDFLEPEHGDQGDSGQAHDSEADPLLGCQLGDFKIEAVIGKGGMGTVYRARESGALERVVAIKVVRRGSDTDSVLDRFRAEQATLARLTHPAIAPVYRAGMTPDGRPWFAMEFVDGLPLIDYCQSHDTPLDQRLALFIELCAAVQHIHQKGFIHRDLKPSNILVRRTDGAVKLIDFGIARALTVDPDSRLTRHQQPLGTPAYMSPEQLDDIEDLDTRSDIYALGVVLYELLTGEHPHGQLQGRALTDAIRTREPLTPSRRLAERENLIAARHPGWRSRLKGDFDWIVLKALACERERRYPTAAALADDLQRALEHRPVMARSPSRTYLAARFFRRHPVAVSASLIGVALLAALSISLWLSGHELERTLEQAVAERERAEQISDFMLETFSAADPHQHRGTELTASELLDQGRARAETLDAAPGVRASILLTMANSYRRLGQYDAAQETAKTALGVVGSSDERTMAEIRAEILASLTTLARDRSDYEASADYARQALAVRRQLFGDRAMPVVSSTSALGYALLKLGDFDAAEPLLQRAVDMYLELGVESDGVDPFQPLASLQIERGRFDQAKTSYRQSLQLSRRIHGPMHPETATRENNLAALFYRTGRLDQAAQHYENALAIQREVLDPLHPYLLTVMNNLGALYNRLGNHERALQILQETLDGRREALGDTHLEVAVTTYHLANALRGKDRRADAEIHYVRAIDIMRQAVGDSDRRVGVLLNGLAELQVEQDDLESAYLTLESALEINRLGWPEGHRTTAHSRVIAAEVGLARGEYARSEDLARLAIDDLKDSPGAEALLARARVAQEVALAELDQERRTSQ